MNPNLKLDIFPHTFPQAFFERVKAIAEQSPTLAAQIKRWLHIPVLWDLEARLRMMERFPGYKQILTLSLPAIEFLAPQTSRRSSRAWRTTAWRRSSPGTRANFPPSSRRFR